MRPHGGLYPHPRGCQALEVRAHGPDFPERVRSGRLVILSAYIRKKLGADRFHT